MSTAIRHASNNENRLPARRSEKARKSNRVTKAPAALRHVSQALHTANDPTATEALRPANGALPAHVPGTAKLPRLSIPAPSTVSSLQSNTSATTRSQSRLSRSAARGTGQAPASNVPAQGRGFLPQPSAPVPTASALAPPATEAQSAASPELYQREAVQLEDVRDDPEREQAYVLLRSAGGSPERARALCKLGLHFARSSSEKNSQTLSLLDAYGVSRSPLCWPRKELELPCALDDCPVLGKGSFNKVFALQLDGHDYGFKPFRKVAERKNDECPISMGGVTLGLKEKDFHPELRNMLAVQLADALGLKGPHGIVDDACVAIVNGVPGLLTPRVRGSGLVHGNMWQEPINTNTPAGKMVVRALHKDANASKTGQPATAVHALGLTHAFRVKDQVFVTGALGKRSNKAAKRFESTSLNAAMKLAQVFIWLANLSDHHPGNILGNLKLIDLDEAFAPVRTDEVAFNNPEDAWILADLPLPVKALPASLAETLKSERCLRRLKRLLVEARDLPDCDLQSLAVRLSWLLKAAKTEKDESNTWKVGQPLDPLQSLLHRVIGFSVHEFGDSENSESVQDDLGAPVAVEIF